MSRTLFILNDRHHRHERGVNNSRPAKAFNDLAAWTAEADKVLGF